MRSCRKEQSFRSTLEVVHGVEISDQRVVGHGFGLVCRWM